MDRKFRTSLTLVLGVGLVMGSVGSPDASGQTREREAVITGPRGRVLDRRFESQMTPRGVSRSLSVQRPGGASLERSVQFGRPTGSAPMQALSRPPMSGGRSLIVERNVLVDPRGYGYRGGGGISPAAGFGIGAAVGTGAGLLLGRVLAPPPPPVIMGAPVIVAPAPPMAYGPPLQYQIPAPTPVVIDPVAQAMARLSSSHANSRREGAFTLGRLHDPRAIPSLVERLKYDKDTDVRIAAAQAIGEIGDPQAAIYLERATIYDKKQQVRDAAAAALARMPRENVMPAVPPSGVNPGASSIPPATSGRAAPSAEGLPSARATPPAVELEPLPDAPIPPAERVPPPPTPAYPSR